MVCAVTCMTMICRCMVPQRCSPGKKKHHFEWPPKALGIMHDQVIDLQGKLEAAEKMPKGQVHSGYVPLDSKWKCSAAQREQN